jgi:hypothetical protein
MHVPVYYDRAWIISNYWTLQTAFYLSYNIGVKKELDEKSFRGQLRRIKKKRLAVIVLFCFGFMASLGFFIHTTLLPQVGAKDLPGIQRLCRIEDLGKVTLKLNKKWFLLGKFPKEKQSLQAVLNQDAELTCNAGSVRVEMLVDNKVKQTESLQASLGQNFAIETGNLKPAAYQLKARLSDVSGGVRLLEKTFYVSHPVLVAWTLDWEGYNFSDEYLDMISKLSNRHQKVPITHFFNPRYFASPYVSSARGKEFLAWIKKRVTSHEDYIGLHLHMFFEMVELAGVKPKKEPTWASRGTGSDVPLTTYNLEDQRKIIRHGLDILKAQGLNSIDAFRAGGWYVNTDTLTVLEELGFKIESSGRTSYSLGNGLPGPWNLTVTQPPYYPCRNSQNFACDGTAAFKVMEVPNNGIESYRYSQAELISRFNQNYKGNAAKNAIAITYLSHPEWFSIDNPKMAALFKHIDQYDYYADNGPVIYANLKQIYNLWK